MTTVYVIGWYSANVEATLMIELSICFHGWTHNFAELCLFAVADLRSSSSQIFAMVMHFSLGALQFDAIAFSFTPTTSLAVRGVGDGGAFCFFVRMIPKSALQFAGYAQLF